jgi:tRNA(Arg) A34 adenosine deaminase TadA
VSENISTKLGPTKTAKNMTCHSAGPILKRRWLLAASGISALFFNTGHPKPVQAHQAKADPILQPTTASASAFIGRAFEMRQRAIDLGDQAYGAVVVKDGEIVGQSWSRVVIDEDPTGHAEMAAIRDTARRLGKRDLSGAVMYSSSPPCPMCEAAAYWAGIGQMIHGRNGVTAGAPKLCR